MGHLTVSVCFLCGALLIRLGQVYAQKMYKNSILITGNKNSTPNIQQFGIQSYTGLGHEWVSKYNKEK